MAHLIINVTYSPLNRAFYREDRLFGEKVFIAFESVVEYWKSVSFVHLIIAFFIWMDVKLMELLSLRFPSLSSETSSPVSNTYKAIASTDSDRMAEAIGCMAMQGNGRTFAMDLGTCVTFDLIQRSNVYQRETINSELSQDKNLYEQIALASLIELKAKPNELVGNNTLTCMQISICHETELEIRKQSQAYIKKNFEIEVFYNGYHVQSFDSLAKDLIFVVPNLIPYGLNSILNNNVE